MAAVRRALKVLYRCARSKSERAGPPACVGNRFPFSIRYHFSTKHPYDAPHFDLLFLAGDRRPESHQVLSDWLQLPFNPFAAQHAFRRKIVEIGVLLHFRERLVLLIG